jgi:hypothetical protein
MKEWFDDGGEGLEISANATPVDFLCAIFRDARQPMHRRLKAAIEAAPYCHPTLKAHAVLMGSDFATRLELATKRTEPALIEAQAIKEPGSS